MKENLKKAILETELLLKRFKKYGLSEDIAYYQGRLEALREVEKELNK